MRALVIVSMLFVFNTTSAQLGYLGKKMSLSYQPAYSFVDYISSRFLFHHKVNFGYSIHDRFQINLSYSKTDKNFENYYARGGWFYVKDRSVGLSMLYFSKNKQAYSPVGKYMGIGYDYGIQNSTYFVEIPPLYPGGDNRKQYRYDDTYRVKLHMLSFYFGHNFIILNRVLFGYGLQAGIPLFDNNDQSVRHLGKPYFNIGYTF